MTGVERASAAPSPLRARSTVQDHLHSLTGLRLFAAVAVYFSHIPVPAGVPVWLSSLQTSGYAGVTFFFVLSGFVLTLNYYDRLSTRRQIWSYTVARLARVYPLYLACLAWPTVHKWSGDSLPKWALLQHLFGVQAWNGDLQVAYGFIEPAWSISVELFLYATLPLLVPLVRLLDRRTWTIVGSIAGILIVLFALAFAFEASGRGALPMTDPGSAHRWLYRTPLVRIGDFLLGILAARLYLRLKDDRGGTRLGRWLIPSALVGTVALASRPWLVGSAWTMDAGYALAGTALILGLALAPNHLISRVLSIRTVVFLGEASFAFYLAHVTVIRMLGAGNAWAEGVTLPALVVELMNLGLAMALAIGLHVGIEKPARVVVRKLLDRPTSPRRHPAAQGHRRNASHRIERHGNRPSPDRGSSGASPGVQDAATAPMRAIPPTWAPPTTRTSVDDVDSARREMSAAPRR